MRSNPLQLYGNNQLAAATMGGIMIRSSDPQALQKAPTLRIAGVGLDQQTLWRAANRMPDVVIRETKGYGENEKIVQAMVSGNTDIDLYVLNSRYNPLESMMQKGYLAPFAPAGGTYQAVKEMHAKLQPAATWQENAYALPFELDFTVTAADTRILAETGLQAPRDIIALAQILRQWSDGLAKQFPNYQFAVDFLPKRTVLGVAFDVYRAHARRQSADWTFDTPVFRQMMESIAAVNTDNIDIRAQAGSQEANDAEEDMFSRQNLLEHYYGYAPRMEHEELSLKNGMTHWMYAALPGEAPVAPAAVRVLAANPRSPHLQEALRFIDLYWQELDVHQRALLTPGFSQAIPNPRFAEDMQSYQTLVKDSEARMAAAQAQGQSESTTDKDELARVRRILQEAETLLRYSLTEEEIKRMHERVDALYIPTQLQATEDEAGGLFDLFSQYQEGAITLDQFISQADAKLALIRAENH